MTAQLWLVVGLWAAAVPVSQRARQTTEVSRKLVLERIDAIARMGSCRQAFGRENIDLDRVRLTAQQVRFYNAEGPEGDLRFSEVVGAPASPDRRLRDLAREVSSDAFVLGYQEGRRYVRTKHVVLDRGYFAQVDAHDGASRPTTEEERQALLLHEVLHIALDKDDDDLNRRELCPLRLLAFCRNNLPVGADHDPIQRRSLSQPRNGAPTRVD